MIEPHHGVQGAEVQGVEAQRGEEMTAEGGEAVKGTEMVGGTHHHRQEIED